MPLYEYRCADCGHEFEIIQKFSDRRLRKCRECGGRLDKLVSRSAFHLKGGGWYSDGYGGESSGASGGGSSDKKKKPKKAGGAAKDSGSSSSDTKSASKPA